MGGTRTAASYSTCMDGDTAQLTCTDFGTFRRYRFPTLSSSSGGRLNSSRTVDRHVLGQPLHIHAPVRIALPDGQPARCPSPGRRQQVRQLFVVHLAVADFRRRGRGTGLKRQQHCTRVRQRRKLPTGCRRGVPPNPSPLPPPSGPHLHLTVYRTPSRSSSVIRSNSWRKTRSVRPHCRADERGGKEGRSNKRGCCGSRGVAWQGHGA